MAFDVTTAIPVERTENNELRTKQFDVNTARPIPKLDEKHPFFDTPYQQYVKQKMDKRIKDAVLQPLEFKDIEEIIKAETETPNALYAFAIPFVRGGAGFFTRPFGVEPFGSTFSPEEVAAARGEHPVATTIGDIIGGISPFIFTAPFFPQTLWGTVGTFGTVAGVQEIGEQVEEKSLMTPPAERIKDITKEVSKAGLFAPIWYYSGMLNFVGRPYASALVRAGTRGIGNATLSKVYGEDLETALREGGLITALSLVFEAPHLAKTALGRGIIKQANRIAAERGLPEGKVKINVDVLDKTSTRSSIFKLVNGLAKLMRIKGKIKAKPSPQDKFLEVRKPIDINPKGLPAKIDSLIPVVPEVPMRPVGTPEFVEKVSPAKPEGVKPPIVEGVARVIPKFAKLSEQTQLEGVIRGDKPIFLTGTESPDWENLIDTAKRAGLKITFGKTEKPYVTDEETGEVISTAKAIVIYPEDNAKEALEALKLVEEGKVTPEYHQKLGELLGYTKEEIESFVKPLTPPQAEVVPDIATPEQIKQAHVIASKKELISKKGKVKPQYRHLAKAMTGKSSIKDMTPAEASIFIDALEKLPEPTFRAGKLVPPTIPRTTAVVTDKYFERTFRKPTPAKLLTSQARYAELLGVKEITEPFEIGKQKLDLEYGKVAKQIDVAIGKLKKPDREKMAKLLNIHEEAPPELSEKETKVFNYFRDLTRDIISRENAVRASLGLEPIKYRKAYFRHTADKMAKEVIEGRYPLPKGIKYWSEQVAGKKVYNPMEMQRKLRDDLLEHFSKDPTYVMKSMVWTGLKEIYLAQPKYFFNKILGALSKDKAVYKNLTPQEKAHYDAQMTMPASTKKWLIDYVNIVLSGRQTALDQSVNLWVTDTPIKDVVNNILRPFGKHIGMKPVTDMITGISRLPIYGVMGGVRPKQLLRNKFQTLQEMALYGVRNTLLGYMPTSSYPVLEELKTDSLFKKSYSGFEDMPVELKGKVEKIGLAPYQWSAMSNVSQAMNAAYHWTANKIQNPKFKEHGWADSKRTYTENKDFFYPSEKERLLKEMEYGAHTTQFQYIGMGMPEIFRYKSLAGITRLQSWWMNHWFIFHREAATRAFTGHTGYDPNLKVTLGDRINYLKYFIIAGLILTTLGYERSYVLGTAPTSLPPPAQLALGLYTYFTHMGDSAWEKRKRAESERNIREAAKTFIPGYLSIKDLLALLSGEKDWTEYLWYKKKAEPKKRGL